MGNGLDDARRAYKAAKRISAAHETMQPLKDDAKILLINASQDYAQALIDDAQRKLDAMGVVIGKTLCCVGPKDVHPFKITYLVAEPEAGIVMAYWDDNLAHEVGMIRPYVAPVVKGMVLGTYHRHAWRGVVDDDDNFRLTLSNVTPADLDAMKPGDVIEGTYKIERMK